MKMLEEELQVRLFVRGSKHIRLTEAGKALYVRAESLLTMTDITKREVIKVSQATTIHLGVTPSTVNMMAKYLVKYTSHHPDIRFVIHDGSTFTLKDELENGILDVTTLRTPIALNGFCSKLLRQEQLMAMVPHGQEEEGLRELTLEELAGHHLKKLNSLIYSISNTLDNGDINFKNKFRLKLSPLNKNYDDYEGNINYFEKTVNERIEKWRNEAFAGILAFIRSGKKC